MSDLQLLSVAVNLHIFHSFFSVYLMDHNHFFTPGLRQGSKLDIFAKRQFYIIVSFTPWFKGEILYPSSTADFALKTVQHPLRTKVEKLFVFCGDSRFPDWISFTRWPKPKLGFLTFNSLIRRRRVCSLTGFTTETIDRS